MKSRTSAPRPTVLGLAVVAALAGSDARVSYSAFANSFDPQYPVPGRFWYVSYTQRF